MSCFQCLKYTEDVSECLHVFMCMWVYDDTYNTTPHKRMYE